MPDEAPDPAIVTAGPQQLRHPQIKCGKDEYGGVKYEVVARRTGTWNRLLVV
jgi:hypothetical protein